MKTVNVVGAVIVRDGEFLATQRGYGEFEGWWEFPGGKVEPGETPEQALVREIDEELEAKIEVDNYLVTAEYDYETFHLSMRCYFCHLIGDHVKLLEHSAAKWLNLSNADTVNWLPADIQVVNAIRASGKM